METTQSINPFSEEEIKTYNRLNTKEINDKLEQAHTYFTTWRNTAIEERATLFLKLAEEFETNTDYYAKLASNEMGKVISQSRGEIEKCAWVCNYYAENAAWILSDEHIKTKASKSYTTHQPLGVILAVMPWNFPFYQVIRFLAPTLMAGNTAVLKHASNVQGCAYALEEALKKVGFEEGCCSNLNVASDQINAIIEDKRIKGVTLTGSENAGKAVGKSAGDNIKPSVLELGGNDAYVILEDCDLDYTVDKCVFGRVQNNGQTCIAAKRFIVVEDIYDDFLQKFTEKMSEINVGNPLLEDTFLGPLARVDLRDELHQQVEESVKQGATLHLGGKIPDRKGAFYPPTILTDVSEKMTAFKDELFGPVATVVKARNENHAIELANNSKFGLGSGVFTKDKERGEKVALQLEAGNSFVNTLTASNPNLPFGGIKASGYGRELSKDGVLTFTNKKTIWIE